MRTESSWMVCVVGLWAASAAGSAQLSGPIQAGDEWITRSVQRIGIAKVSGTWSKSVSIRVGPSRSSVWSRKLPRFLGMEAGAGREGIEVTRTVHSAGERAPDLPAATAASAEAAVARLESLRDRVELALKSALPAFARASFVYPWQMEIDPVHWEPAWQIDFVDERESGVWRAIVGADLRVRSHKQVSSGLVDGHGTAFPLGPRVSAPERVSLEGLIGDGTLSGPQISITSGVDPRAFSPEQLFQFPLDDPRFDEVQAYFFLGRALSYFRESLGTPLVNPLVVKVNVGGSKGNAAFYYGQRIFLGPGDGVTYRGLVRDPSVVYHEAAHALIDQLAGLPSQGEGGSLNEAFADFIVAAMLDNPNIGEASYLQGPYRRTLNNRLRAPADLGGNLYGDSLVVSGTLWDLRRSLGLDKAQSLAIGAMARLGEGSKFKDFAQSLLKSAEARLTLEDQRVVAMTLSERGWIK